MVTTADLQASHRVARRVRRVGLLEAASVSRACADDDSCPARDTICRSNDSAGADDRWPSSSP
jgi:hypothetical protein